MVYFLENKIFTFLFGLHATNQTIVAYETQKLDDKGRMFQIVKQIFK